eukprot:SM000070S21359  [mRNA]  locus=s70:625729:629256:- [translate_table: standard]
MWRLKNLAPRDAAGGASLEGRTVDVGGLRLQVRAVVAQGGFSFVYAARCAATGAGYALKQIVCGDAESLVLARREVGVLLGLQGHPNVVALAAHAYVDAGERGTDCLLAMEFCDKMLVNVMEARGARLFEEPQVLLIFRDVCNAVCAMHSQSPPIAHRDLKAENVLLSGNSTWKLCDFGSTSTTHKRFDRAEEMGAEEDIIRKHTTPAYRAPELWDLYRRDFINEKVDIWALGCLLYRLAYFKSCFDGESKLQILNGNYQVPDSPTYSSSLVGLIKDMLNSSPDARPNIMQVWHRANELLPLDKRRAHPDLATSSGSLSASKVASVLPTILDSSNQSDNGSVKSARSGGKGAFWSTPYAQSQGLEDNAAAGPYANGVSPEAELEHVRRSPPLPVLPRTSQANRSPYKGLGVATQLKKATGAVVNRATKEVEGYSMMLDGKVIVEEKKDDVPQSGRRVNGIVRTSPDRRDQRSQSKSPELAKAAPRDHRRVNSLDVAPQQIVGNDFVATLEEAKPLYVADKQAELSKSGTGCPGSAQRHPATEIDDILKRTRAEHSELLVKCERLERKVQAQEQEIRELRLALEDRGGLLDDKSAGALSKVGSSAVRIAPSSPAGARRPTRSPPLPPPVRASGGTPHSPTSPSWQPFGQDAMEVVTSTADPQVTPASAMDPFAGSIGFELLAPAAQNGATPASRALKVAGANSLNFGASLTSAFTAIAPPPSSGGEGGVGNASTNWEKAKKAPSKTSQPAGWAGF